MDYECIFEGKRYRLTFPAQSNLGFWYRHEIGNGRVVIRQIWRLRLVTRG